MSEAMPENGHSPQAEVQVQACEIEDPQAGDAATKGISMCEAASHLVRGNLGPGCLALPYAFAQAGWFYGIMILLATMAQGLYAMTLLAQCRNLLAGYGVCTLGDVAEIALGPRSKAVVQMFLLIVQGGVCCVYIDLVSENVLEMTENLEFSREHAVFVILPAFATLALFRSVAGLTFLSGVGNLSMGVSCFVAALCGGFSILAPHKASVWEQAFSPRRGAVDLIQLAASTFYSFEGIGLVLPIENAMAAPAQFNRALGIAACVLTLAYISVGVLCGVAYHDEIASGSITAFLAENTKDPVSRALLILVNVLVTGTVAITFPLQLLPAAEIVEQWMSRCTLRCRWRRRQATNYSPAAPDFSHCACPGPPPEVMGRTDEGGDGASGVHVGDKVPFKAKETNGSDVRPSSWQAESGHGAGETVSDKVPFRGQETNGSDVCFPSWVRQRICMVLAFGAVTLLVSNVALLVSLFGAVGQAGLGGLAPLCHLVLMRRRIAPWSCLWAVLDVLILCFCLVVMVVGSAASVADIVRSLEQQ